MFSAEEVRAISSLPVSLTNQLDQQVWKGTAHALRSAYYLAKEVGNLQTAEESRRQSQSNMWGILWKMTIPNAEKTFMWCACHNLLATKDNLLKRKVSSDPFCPICETNEETVYHILWSCPSAMDVWGASDRTFQKTKVKGLDFFQVAEMFFEKCREVALLFFMRMARKIWLRRNEYVFNGRFTHPDVLIREVRSSMEMFANLNGEAQGEQQRSSTTVQEKWIAPKVGWHKANWDAALDSSKGHLGIGYCDS